jgi:thiosulfate/3-mercaptopyruvate sulfurtransferase
MVWHPGAMARLPPLVDAGTLAAHLDQPSLRIFDATVHLRRVAPGTPYVPESGRAGYEEGHLPGAAFADLIGDLADPASPFPFTIPSPERFAAAAGALGIGPDTHVVAYSQTSVMWATRLWWLLGYFGHDKVSVLDGGFEAWRETGCAVATGPVSTSPARFDARPRPERLARRPEVEAVVAAGNSGPASAPSTPQLVNALRPDAFAGLSPGAYGRPGRIPGSINAPYIDLLDASGRFRHLDEIGAALDAAGLERSEAIIAYCGGGISATVDLFALDLLGTEARLYDGSLTEWSADPSLPLETDHLARTLTRPPGALAKIGREVPVF